MRIIFLFILLFVSCQDVKEQPKSSENQIENTTSEPMLFEGKTEPVQDSGVLNDISQTEARSNATLCQEAKSNWNSFREKATKCSEGDNCVAFGFYGNCDCAYGIAGVGPGGAGIAINAKYLEEAKQIEARFFAYCDGKICSADVLPSSSRGCVDGKCRLSSPPGCRP